MTEQGVDRLEAVIVAGIAQGQSNWLPTSRQGFDPLCPHHLTGRREAWSSRLPRTEEIGGSNPPALTIHRRESHDLRRRTRANLATASQPEKLAHKERAPASGAEALFRQRRCHDERDGATGYPRAERSALCADRCHRRRNLAGVGRQTSVQGGGQGIHSQLWS